MSVNKNSVIRVIEIVLTLFVGLGAVVGAVMMWIDPSGQMWGMAPLLDKLRVKMPWPEGFFGEFIPSGIVLIVLNGFTQFTALVLLLRRHRLAPYAVLVCGIVLMMWTVLEWWVWGFNIQSDVFFGLGVIETVVALISLKHKPKRFIIWKN